MIIICQKCGYRWVYKGKHRASVNCPDCRNWVKMVNGDSVDQSPKQHVHVKCVKCGYEWNYSGKNKTFVQCPDCRSRTPITQDALSYKQTVHVKCSKCEYEWGYSGTKKRATCPDCGHKTLTGVQPVGKC